MTLFDTMNTTLKINQAGILDLDNGEIQDADLYLENGIIKEISSKITISAADTLDARGLILTSGLCDAHAHIFYNTREGYIGLDPEVYHLRKGTTCIIDQGSAGADCFELFHRHVIVTSELMIKEVLNCSRMGMYASSLCGPGELANLGDLSQTAFLSVYQKHPEDIIGVKLRLTPNICPHHPEKALKMASDLAAELEVPLVIHPNGAEIEDRLLFETLRTGDIYTHTYHDSPVGILNDRGEVKELAWEARKRGVIFDTAHGSNSLTFPVLHAALEQGFEPDIISTDLHNGNYNGPVYDLPTTISKFLCLGVPLHTAVNKALTAPVRIWKLKGKSTCIRAGQSADLAAFRLDRSGHEYTDAQGNRITGPYRLIPQFTILKTRVHFPCDS